MTVRRRRQHPSDFGRASTFVETVELPELEEPSIRGSCGDRLLRPGRAGVQAGPARRRATSCWTSTPGPGATTRSGRPPGWTSPTCSTATSSGLPSRPVRARPGVRWVRLRTDVPNAVRDMRGGDARAARLPAVAARHRHRGGVLARATRCPACTSSRCCPTSPSGGDCDAIGPAGEVHRVRVLAPVRVLRLLPGPYSRRGVGGSPTTCRPGRRPPRRRPGRRPAAAVLLWSRSGSRRRAPRSLPARAGSGWTGSRWSATSGHRRSGRGAAVHSAAAGVRAEPIVDGDGQPVGVGVAQTRRQRLPAVRPRRGHARTSGPRATPARGRGPPRRVSPARRWCAATTWSVRCSRAGCSSRMRRVLRPAAGPPTFPGWPVEHSLHDLYDWLLDDCRRRRGRPGALARPVAGRQGLGAGADPRRRDPASGTPTWSCSATDERCAATARPGTSSRSGTTSTTTVRRALRGDGCEVGVHGLRHDGRTWRRGGCSSSGCPAIRRHADALGRGRVPLPGHPARLGADARAGLRLRLVLHRHRPLRAPARRLLHLPAVLQRAAGGAADHAAAGPHAVRDPAAPDGTLWLDKAREIRRRRRHGAGAEPTPTTRATTHARRRGGSCSRSSRDDPTVWQALPREVAAWWRDRAASAPAPGRRRVGRSGPAADGPPSG